MKPLIPQTVYIPIRGIETNFRLIQTVQGNDVVPTIDWETEHLEKKENQYILTKEELIELLENAMTESVKMYNGFYDNLKMDEDELRQQFINNLLNQQ